MAILVTGTKKHKYMLEILRDINGGKTRSSGYIGSLLENGKNNNRGNEFEIYCNIP